MISTDLDGRKAEVPEREKRKLRERAAMASRPTAAKEK
jgi:hypothetical protein